MSRRLVDGKLIANSKGRPKETGTLTPELVERIVAPIRIGSPIDTAFALQNVSYGTLRNWVLKAHEDPNSLYGILIGSVRKAIAEWEIRDLAAWDKFIVGSPVEYEKEPIIDKKGKPVLGPDGKVLMKVVRDGEGNPVVRHPAIVPDWRAAAERLKRRRPKIWADPESVGSQEVLAVDNLKAATQEAKTFQEKVAEAIQKFDEEY